MLLAVLMAACGSTVGSGVARPSPSSTPIPWLADVAVPTPLPTPTIPPQPTGMRECVAAEIRTATPRGQGAGGWATRSVILASAGRSSCLLVGPTSVAYMDGETAVVTSVLSAPPSWSGPGWVVLQPGNVPLEGPRAGQARLTLETYGDCHHATMNAIAMTFAGHTGTVIAPTESQTVGGRCDDPGAPQHLSLGWWALGPSQLPDFPIPAPFPLGFTIDPPPVAFASEPLRYLLRVRNIGATTFTWPFGCPIYVESLGGREVSPTAVPGHAKQPPDKVYAGFAKELHPLDCAAGGPIAPGAEIAFEMRIDVPRDAYGADTLYWNIAGPFPTGSASAPIEFLAPRRY